MKPFGGTIYGHIWGLITDAKNDITFSYSIRITKILASWKSDYEGYVMNLSRYSFGFYIICSSCNIGKCIVHACGIILWWNMYFMDRAHLGYWYVILSLGIFLWIHYICYGGYDGCHLKIDFVWVFYMDLSRDSHASHGLRSILLSSKCMKFV